jgi:hypothetical protein
MATLILTAVGSAIGGPIGGAIGSILGQQIDRSLFAPKARQGPRLGSLAVQTSVYGQEIPKVFGMMRVAGTVIWATDLIESRSSGGGGKGRPKTITYAYSANFAVALSGRPVLGVRRIWADGKLLRGSAGDFKTATGYRLHLGHEDQNPDPLIVSAEGAGRAPAFRGIAYAVFENFQLEDYGNRIPSLTFEVEADSAPVSIGAIAKTLAGTGVAAGGPTGEITGYAAAGGSIRAAIEALTQIVPVSITDRDGVLRFGNIASTPVSIEVQEEIERRQILRRAADSVPAEVSLAYYDVARDHQAGLQRATTGAPEGGVVDRQDLPISISAGGAKALAEARLASLRTGRLSARVSLGWRRSALHPGDLVTVAGEAGVWRTRRRTLGPMSVALELTRVSGASSSGAVTATPGAGVRQPDLVHGPTTLRMFDLPLGEPRGAQPLLFAAAAGVEEGWRRAALIASFDGGISWQDCGSTAPPAVMGIALTTLAPAGTALFDAASSVEVELLNESMWLETMDDDALVGGANLAVIGGELVQFGTAAWLGARRFRLSRFLRGRRGTEWAIQGHGAGDPFTLIEPEALAVVEAPVGATGGSIRLNASGVGDLEPVTADLPVTAESLRPPSPAHLAARRFANGDIHIRWVRRSRLGWSWASGSDTPLGEESEAYRVTLSGAGFERSSTTGSPSHLYTVAEQAADGLSGALGISVTQIGTYAVSRPATLLVDQIGDFS